MHKFHLFSQFFLKISNESFAVPKAYFESPSGGGSPTLCVGFHLQVVVWISLEYEQNTDIVL